MEKLHPHILNLEEASAYLGYKKSYLYKLTACKIIPFSKPNGKRIFFDKQKLDEWMLGNTSSSLQERKIAAATYVSTH